MIPSYILLLLAGLAFTAVRGVVHAAPQGPDAVLRPPHYEPEAGCSPPRGFRRGLGALPKGSLRAVVGKHSDEVFAQIY